MMQYWVQLSEEELQRMKMRCSNRSAGDAHSAANEWTNQRVHPEAPTCSLATGRGPTGIRLTCFNTCTIAIATLSPHHSTLPSKHKFPGSVSCLLTFICLVFIFLIFSFLLPLSIFQKLLFPPLPPRVFILPASLASLCLSLWHQVSNLRSLNRSLRTLPPHLHLIISTHPSFPIPHTLPLLLPLLLQVACQRWEWHHRFENVWMNTSAMRLHGRSHLSTRRSKWEEQTKAVQEVGKMNVLDVLEHGDRNKGNVSSCDRLHSSWGAMGQSDHRENLQPLCSFMRLQQRDVCASEEPGGKKVGESGDSWWVKEGEVKAGTGKRRWDGNEAEIPAQTRWSLCQNHHHPLRRCHDLAKRFPSMQLKSE